MLAMILNNKWTRVAIALLLLVGVERFCRHQTAGFRIDKIHSEFNFSSPTAKKLPSPIAGRLDQPFHFLGSGVQCYAFLGEDNKTVIKLFKHYHNFPIKGSMRTVTLPAILDSWRSQILESRENRLSSIFTSCTLAYDNFKEESGLLYIHLQHTDSLNKKITVLDKLGIAHEVDLDKTAFVVQEKAEMLKPKITRLLKEGKLEEARACVHSLYQHIIKRSELGISNHDLRVERNIGFIGNQAVEIDIGSFKVKKKQSHKKELEKCKHWIAHHFPELKDQPSS